MMKCQVLSQAGGRKKKRTPGYVSGFCFYCRANACLCVGFSKDEKHDTECKKIFYFFLLRFFFLLILFFFEKVTAQNWDNHLKDKENIQKSCRRYRGHFIVGKDCSNMIHGNSCMSVQNLDNHLKDKENIQKLDSGNFNIKIRNTDLQGRKKKYLICF